MIFIPHVLVTTAVLDDGVRKGRPYIRRPEEEALILQTGKPFTYSHHFVDYFQPFNYNGNVEKLFYLNGHAIRGQI